MHCTVAIRPRRVLLWFFLAAFALTCAHLISVTLWYKDLIPTDNWLFISFFDLDEEESIGTWFSATILFLAGQLTLLVRRLCSIEGRWFKTAWLFLGVGFHLLSLDEIAGFHEFVNTLSTETHWTTYGIVLSGFIALCYIPFLMALAPFIRLMMIVSGLCYLGGAVGVEILTISYENKDLLNTLPYNLWNGLEEFMEMFGVILYLYTVLAFIGSHAKNDAQKTIKLTCTFEPDTARP